MIIIVLIVTMLVKLLNELPIAADQDQLRRQRLAQ